MIFFVLIFFTIWLGLHVYLGWRFSKPLRTEKKRLVWAAVAVHFVVSLLGMGMRRFPDLEPAYSIVKWAYYVGMGMFFLLVSLMLLKDIAWWVYLGGARFLARREAKQVDRDRRDFLATSLNLGVLTAATGGTALGYYEARRLPDLVRVKVPVEHLPRALEKFRIVQLSDMHVGPTVRKATVQRLVEEVNKLNPDLVVITGDLIEGHVEHIWSDVAPILELKSRYGTYYCTGNHEYYWDGLGWCEKLSSAGIVVLNNEHRLIEHDGARVLVAGCTDIRAHRFVESHRSDPAAALIGAPAHDLSLLLAHQPASIQEAAKAGYDVQLSGHTHGGQFFPGPLFIDLFHPYSVGLHREDRTWIYVSRGTGYWGPPMRLKAPSEITLIEFVAGSAELARVERSPLSSPEPAQQA
jgi:uncharacterized protein